MKKSQDVFEYPIVLRKHLNYMSFSIPDLGIFATLDLPPNNKFTPQYFLKMATEIAKLWLKASLHLKEKKWTPLPSDIRHSIKKAERRALSPLQFAKLTGVSEQTIRRDIDRGLIKAKRTSGGYRKIPETQVPMYLQFLDSGKKRARVKRYELKKFLNKTQ